MQCRVENNVGENTTPCRWSQSDILSVLSLTFIDNLTCFFIKLSIVQNLNVIGLIILQFFNRVSATTQKKLHDYPSRGISILFFQHIEKVVRTTNVYAPCVLKVRNSIYHKTTSFTNKIT